MSENMDDSDPEERRPAPPRRPPAIVLDDSEDEEDPSSLEEGKGRGYVGSNVPSSSGVSNRPKSKVWEHMETFYCEVRGCKVVECLECRRASKVKAWKTVNTGNLKMHLQKYHADVWIPDMVVAGQSTMHQFFGSKKRKKPPVGKGKKFTQGAHVAADKVLLRWIVNHPQPYSVVENEDFMEFCEILEESYCLPTRNTVKNRILKQHLDQRKKVKVFVYKASAGRRCGLTSDMWTSAAKRGYMVVTLHFIDDNWEMKDIILGFVRVMYPHTADRLADALLKCVVDLEPKLLHRIWTVTGDNASTNPAMVTFITNKLSGLIMDLNSAEIPDDAAMAARANANHQVPEREDDAADFELIRCLAHVLQLGIKEATAECSIVNNAIGRFRDTVKKISDSPKLTEAIENLCDNWQGLTYSAFELDCETRWNSTYDMMSHICGPMRKPLEELLRRIRERQAGYTDFSIAPDDDLASEISNVQWSAANDYCTFLKKFKAATVMISGSTYPTLGIVIPVMHLLLNHCKSYIEANDGFRSSHATAFAQVVEGKLLSYWDRVCNPFTICGAVLDPRIKDHVSRCDVSLARQTSTIKTMWRSRFESFYDKLTTAASGMNPGSGSAPGQARDRVSSNRDADENFFDEFLIPEAGADGEQGQERSAAGRGRGVSSETFANELKRWMAHSPMPLTQSSREVCMWFKLNESMFPRISFMARDLLAVTATSVPSEVAFSKSGDQISKRRARLGDDSVQAIMELQSWLKLRL